MIEIKLSYLLNSTPVGYLTNGLWITKGGKVLPLELNEFADYKLKPNRKKESIKLEYEDYERLTFDYFRNLVPRTETIAKHLAGKHDQSSHAGGRRASAESPSFSDDEIEAISTYSGSATVQINHQLRGLSRTRGIQPALGVWRMSEEKIDRIVEKIDSAIDKSALTESLTLQRYVPTNSLRSGLFGSVKGKTISDKGYLSLRKGTTEVPPPLGFVTMKIKAPKGTKALDLSFINPNAMGEVIFPRNTQIKVTNIVGTGDDTTVIGEIVNG